MIHVRVNKDVVYIAVRYIQVYSVLENDVVKGKIEKYGT